MTLADDLLPVIDGIRAIPGQLGLRPNRVYLVATEWDGAYTGEGEATEDADEITVGSGQPPKVRQLNDEQLAMGQLAAGAIEIGPVTPSYSGGGVSAAVLLAQAVAAGDTRHVRVVGPAGIAVYRVTSVTTHRALNFMFRCEPAGSEPIPEEP